MWQRQPRFYCQRVQEKRQTEEGKIVVKMASRANLGCLPRSDSLNNNNDQIMIIMIVVMLMMITQVIIEWR